MTDTFLCSPQTLDLTLLNCISRQRNALKSTLHFGALLLFHFKPILALICGVSVDRAAIVT